jgi:hypothetical protein
MCEACGPVGVNIGYFLLKVGAAVLAAIPAFGQSPPGQRPPLSATTSFRAQHIFGNCTRQRSPFESEGTLVN